MHNQFPGQINQGTVPLEQKVTTTTYSVQSSSVPQNITQTRTTGLTSNAPLSNLTTGHPTTGTLSGQQSLMGHHTIGNTGIGTITFRPIQGRFNKDKDWIGKMDPYCKFKIGWRSGKSSVAKGQGMNATWVGDAVTIKVKNHEFAKLKVKDKDRLRPDDRIGSAQIPLAQVVQQGKTTQRVPIMKKGMITGEVELEMVFAPKF